MLFHGARLLKSVGCLDHLPAREDRGRVEQVRVQRAVHHKHVRLCTQSIHVIGFIGSRTASTLGQVRSDWVYPWLQDAELQEITPFQRQFYDLYLIHQLADR